MTQVTLEGNLVNLDVTSPASTLALGLMFLRTNDEAIAAGFTVPSTRFALDLVRPDFIMLRVLARNLVMWDAVQPTAAWLSSQLPDIIKVGRGRQAACVCACCCLDGGAGLEVWGAVW